MKGKQADVLDECLRRILDRGESLEQCLKSYPDQADELRPLLLTALSVKAATSCEAAPAFKAQLKASFRPVRAVRPVKAAAPRWRFQWAAVSLGIAIFLAAGGSTIAAAQTSMPESPLYPVKLASEQVQLALTPSQEGKALLNAKFVDRRIAELDHELNQKGNGHDVNRVIDQLNQNLDGVGSIGDTPASAGSKPAATPPAGSTNVPPGQVNKEDASKMQEYAQKHNQELQRLAQEAPPNSRGAVQKAQEHSSSSYNKALKAMGGKGKD